MSLSKDMDDADAWVEQVLAKQEARAEKLDRETGYFADDRAAELDRAVANVEAFGKDRTAEAQDRIEKAQHRADG